MQKKYAFIGGGNMARCMIGGLINAGLSPDQLIVSDPYAPSRAALAAEFGVSVCESNVQAAQSAGIWVLAIKPQMFPSVAAELAECKLGQPPLVISILAGIPTSALALGFKFAAKIVRAMPNTPALLGAGVSGLYAGADVSELERAEAQALLQVCGATAWVAQEHLMDTVTATSGSGPAYFFLLMEAMIDAAKLQGLSDALARTLVLETALGAALMAKQSNAMTEPETVATLRQRVTSPGGTTAAALQVFEAQQLRSIVEAALEAARARGAEMASQFGAAAPVNGAKA